MREGVEGLRFRCVLLFFYKCARTLAGPDVSQLCSTSKQYLIQKEQENLPALSLPPFHYPPSSATMKGKKKNRHLATQCNQNTCVYVSYRNQDMETGGKTRT